MSRLRSVVAHSRRAFGAALVLLAAGCSSVTEPSLRDLVVAKQRWAAASVGSYRITVSVGCFCGFDVTRAVIVSVGNGVVESRRFADTGEEVPASLASVFPTVEGLFAIIDDAIAHDYARVDATYDPRYGFPMSIALDGRTQIADDEVFYQARDFTRPVE